jgi:hypothetical protein
LVHQGARGKGGSSTLKNKKGGHSPPSFLENHNVRLCIRDQANNILISP